MNWSINVCEESRLTGHAIVHVAASEGENAKERPEIGASYSNESVNNTGERGSELLAWKVFIQLDFEFSALK